MKYRYLLPSFFLGLIFVLVNCQSKPTLPSLVLRLDAVDSTDSMIRLVYWGEDVWREDSVRLAEVDSIVLQPDTTGVRYALATHASGSVGCYYQLVGNRWIDTLPPAYRAATLAEQAAPLDEKDAEGKDHALYELARRRWLVMTFSDLSLRTLTRAQRDSLSKKYGKDSVRFVYMMLTNSDSVALSRIRRDSLRGGTVYSDTLALVSRLRHEYGIDRAAKPQTFLIDSLGKIKRIKI